MSADEIKNKLQKDLGELYTIEVVLIPQKRINNNIYSVEIMRGLVKLTYYQASLENEGEFDRFVEIIKRNFGD